jgi:glycosyltransferase involved in cell wall biosynthesis
MPYEPRLNDQINVMQIISNLSVGGAQEVVRTLVDYLATSRECQPMVCTFEGGPLLDPIQQSGIRVEMLPQRRYTILALPLFVADMIRLWKLLARLIQQYQIDVIQTHLLRSLDFLMLLLLYTTDVQAVFWTFHSANFELTQDRLPGKQGWLLAPKKLIHRLSYRLATRLAPRTSGFVAISDRVKESMVEALGPIGDRITVICNGVDTKRYGRAERQRSRDEDKNERSTAKAGIRNQLGLAPDVRLIAMVGTLKKVKGHCYIIEAMSALAPRHPDVHLLIIGDGELRDDLQAQVTEQGLLDRIHFLGSRQDIPDLLATCDLFVLPSLWEGLSMALLEAMATGLPIVASSVSGTVQAIIPNQTGLLVPPGNVIELAEAIDELLSDPSYAQALGAAAKQRAQAEFSAQKQANEHLALYHRSLSRKFLSHLSPNYDDQSLQ